MGTLTTNSPSNTSPSDDLRAYHIFVSLWDIYSISALVDDLVMCIAIICQLRRWMTLCMCYISSLYRANDVVCK
jgi:hypothetical protein